MTREKAIKILNSLFLVAEVLKVDKEKRREIKDALNMAIQALSREWIPVSERLPEPESDYQVLVNVIAPDKTYHIIITSSWEVVEYAQKGWVNAWQPLPEPYKGGDTE